MFSCDSTFPSIGIPTGSELYL